MGAFFCVFLSFEKGKILDPGVGLPFLAKFEKIDNNLICI